LLLSPALRTNRIQDHERHLKSKLLVLSTNERPSALFGHSPRDLAITKQQRELANPSMAAMRVIPSLVHALLS
jgi:hypothetical protein